MTSGRREGGGARSAIVVTHKLCVDQPQVYQTTSCIDTVFRMLQSQVLGQDITGRTSRFFVGHRPPSRLPSRLPDVTHVTLSPRPSLRFYTASDQNWSRERPGNEAILRGWGADSASFPGPVRKIGIFRAGPGDEARLIMAVSAKF